MSLFRIAFLDLKSRLPTSNQEDDTYSVEKDIFIDIATDTGQISRRIHLGIIKCPAVHRLYNITHVTQTQISLILVEGKNNRQLGVSTILDFGKTKQIITMDFGQRNTAIYSISFVIEKVKYRYAFLLNTVTCLKQVSSEFSCRQNGRQRDFLQKLSLIII